MNTLNAPRPMRRGSDGVWTGINFQGLGVSVKDIVYQRALEVYRRTEGATDNPEDPDTWMGQEDGEYVWTW